MNNTILTTLASVNASIVGIIFAILVAFFVYSYTELSEIKEKLTDLRLETRKMMDTGETLIVGDIEFSEYIYKDNIIDYRKIMKELEIIAGMPGYIPGEVKGNSSIEKIKFRAIHLLKIISLISVSTPYYEAKKNVKGSSMSITLESERFEYDEKWENTLINFNRFLVWFWHGRKNEIMHLMHSYKEIEMKERVEEFKARRNKALEGLKKKPNGWINLSDQDIEKKLSVSDMDYGKNIFDFFERVNEIETNIVPQVKELSFKLNLFQEKFGIKKNVVLTLFFIIFILIFGVFLPMFVHLYFKEPHVKTIEVSLLCTTMLPYLIILIILLKKALVIEFK